MKEGVMKFILGAENDFNWFNEPLEHTYDQEGMYIKTKPYTDFWQRTHYGFQRDDGHCFLTKVSGDCSLIAHLEFSSKVMYDQCGVMLRIDSDNWVKASIEYENEQISRLGSVVTNYGYSDWATTDISTKIHGMWYKISKNHQDILLENSLDGIHFQQMRVLHLHKESDNIYIGVYACSPKDSSFECKINKIIFGRNEWEYKG